MSLSEGCRTLQNAKLMRRDHWTIKLFVANAQQGCKKGVEKKRHKLTVRDLRQIKIKSIFQNCNLISFMDRWMRVTLDGPDGQ